MDGGVDGFKHLKVVEMKVYAMYSLPHRIKNISYLCSRY
jgi:hypothetical protein